MTLGEFEQRYAARSGITREQFVEAGLRGVPCYCGEGTCCGWRAAYVSETREDAAERSGLDPTALIGG